MAANRETDYAHVANALWHDIASVFTAGMNYGGYVRSRMDSAPPSQHMWRQHALVCHAIQSAKSHGLGFEACAVMRAACRAQIAIARKTGGRKLWHARPRPKAEPTRAVWLERSQPHEV